MLKREFDLLAEKLGSPYAAIHYISQSARKKRQQVDNRILESEAITWALTGVQPKLRKRVRNISDEYNLSYLDEVLSYVDDDEVCTSVRESYSQSVKSHHLIYCYHNNLDEDRKARVRVLTKMVWYNIEQEGGL